jgi:preprotein translocase subunit SecY
VIDALRNAWKIQDLKKKIIITFWLLAVYRLGAHIPVPGVNARAIADMIGGGTLLGFLDLMSGGAFSNFSIFALTIGPYITASIVMNLLTIVIPKLEQLAKEGEAGRKIIAQYTRYATVILALIQGFSTSVGFRFAVINPGPMSTLIITLTLTAGTAFLMWLGEQITEKGIGNGISLIIFISIISRLPQGAFQLYSMLRVQAISIFAVLFLGILALIVIIGIIVIQEGQRRIPVQYAKRVVGRKMYGGQSTHIPLKVNQAGVIPVIFASSLLLFPGTLASFFPANRFALWVTNFLRPEGIAYPTFFTMLIIGFTYFYTAVTFNPADISNNIKKYGGFIPGIRPGHPTTQYLEKVLVRITLVGAVFLAIIAVMPIILNRTDLQIGFGGVGMIIVVGVALETMKQIEAQMLMRHYKGFLK